MLGKIPQREAETETVAVGIDEQGEIGARLRYRIYKSEMADQIEGKEIEFKCILIFAGL